MACSNCFNGCTEIISDQCVKYTGNNIPALGIETGDTLADVELSITNFILTLSTGSGIVPVINQSDVCDLVKSFLPVSGTITINHVLTALIKSVCSLKTSVTAIESTLNTLNADYIIGCLSGVTSSSDTHDILQAAINKLCATDASLTALLANLPINYVSVASLNSRIQAYINSNQYTPPPTTYYRDRMVPYVVYEYYGSLDGFDIDGKGSGQWDKVYLCNGNNGTPDRRGRVAVGATSGMGGGAMSSTVAPGGGNPNYTLEGLNGQNTVTLTEQQMPSHNHTATAVSTSAPHTHFIARNAAQTSADLLATTPLDDFNNDGDNTYKYKLRGTSGVADVGPTSPSTVIVNTSVNIADKGGNLAHPNVQPGIGAYFIQYRP